MRQFVFNENDDVDLNKIAEELFMNTNACDPSSIYYERHLERPNISWIRVSLHIIVPAIIFVFIVCIFLHAGASHVLSIIFACTIFFLYIFLSFKKILICFIHIYQHFAPDSIRMKCRFEPSCSQYMIMALEKYGVLKGLRLGLRRLKKCKIGNGGFDFP